MQGTFWLLWDFYITVLLFFSCLPICFLSRKVLSLVSAVLSCLLKSIIKEKNVTSLNRSAVLNLASMETLISYIYIKGTKNVKQLEKEENIKLLAIRKGIFSCYRKQVKHGKEPAFAVAVGKGKLKMPQTLYGLVCQMELGCPFSVLCSLEHAGSSVTAEKGREHFFT